MSGFASFEKFVCQTVIPLHTNGYFLLVVIQTWLVHYIYLGVLGNDYHIVLSYCHKVKHIPFDDTT